MIFKNSKLSNNLNVIGEVNDSAHSVAIGFFVKTGARDETPNISGVSHFLEHMMFKGTEKRSALDVTYELGRIGAQANAYTSEENTVYYATILPEYFEEAVELLSDMLRPSLVQEEFDVEKKVILEEIALYQDRPTHVLFESAMKEFFGEHPAGSSVLGTNETVGNLTRDQMHAYFDARYTPSNITFAVAGNFDWDKCVSLIDNYCGSWIDSTAPRPLQDISPVEKTCEITKENINRAHVCLVGHGPAAADESRYPSAVLSCILGDSSGSRTFWELVDKGLVDVAGIGTDEMDGTGMVYGYASASPENLEEVTTILRNIFSQASNITEEELVRAKTKLRTRLVLQGEGSRRRLMALGNDWVYRNKYLTLEEELKKLEAISRNDILSFLDTYSFQPTCTVTLVPAP